MNRLLAHWPALEHLEVRARGVTPFVDNPQPIERITGVTCRLKSLALDLDIGPSHAEPLLSDVLISSSSTLRSLKLVWRGRQAQNTIVLSRLLPLAVSLEYLEMEAAEDDLDHFPGILRSLSLLQIFRWRTFARRPSFDRGATERILGEATSLKLLRIENPNWDTPTKDSLVALGKSKGITVEWQAADGE